MRAMRSIAEALAGRQLAQDLRKMGVMTGGPKPMQPKDMSRFLGRLEQMLVAIDHQRGGQVDCDCFDVVKLLK